MIEASGSAWSRHAGPRATTWAIGCSGVERRACSGCDPNPGGPAASRASHSLKMCPIRRPDRDRRQYKRERRRPVSTTHPVPEPGQSAQTSSRQRRLVQDRSDSGAPRVPGARHGTQHDPSIAPAETVNAGGVRVIIRSSSPVGKWMAVRPHPPTLLSPNDHRILQRPVIIPAEHQVTLAEWQFLRRSAGPQGPEVEPRPDPGIPKLARYRQVTGHPIGRVMRDVAMVAQASALPHRPSTDRRSAPGSTSRPNRRSWSGIWCCVTGPEQLCELAAENDVGFDRPNSARVLWWPPRRGRVVGGALDEGADRRLRHPASGSASGQPERICR
jgi:hypothetical protein